MRKISAPRKQKRTEDAEKRLREGYSFQFTVNGEKRCEIEFVGMLRAREKEKDNAETLGCRGITEEQEPDATLHGAQHVGPLRGDVEGVVVVYGEHEEALGRDGGAGLGAIF